MVDRLLIDGYNRRMRGLRIAYAEAFLCVIIWGLSFIATKVALRQASPVTLVWLRFGMGVLLLGGAAGLRGQLAWPARNEIGYFALLGFSGIAFHQWLQSTGMLTSQANTTAWIVATTPVFMALLGWLFLKESLSWLQVGGIFLAALGVLLVVYQGDLGAIAMGGFGAPGDALILISSVNWAVFTTLSRPGLQRHPATRMMFFVMTFGWLFSSVLFLAQSGWGEVSQLTSPGWLAVGFLGIFCSGLAYILWYDALQMIPGSQLGVFIYIEPLVTAVAAAWMLAEPLLAATLLGGVIILAGVWMVNRTEK